MSARLFTVFGTIFAVTACLLISPPLFAAPSNPGAIIGTVDLSLLVIFHPHMAWYDPHQKQFRKQSAPKTAAETARKGQEKSEQSQQIAQQTRLLEGKMEETRRNFDRQTRALQVEFDRKVTDLATGTAAVERNMFQIRNNQLHQKFTAEIKALAAQIQILEQQFSATAGSDATGQLCSPAETEQMFRNILQEVRNTVAQVAAAKGISIVLDRGPSDLVGTLNLPETMLPSENTLARLLSAAPGPNASKDPAAMQGHFSYQASLGQTWLRSRLAILGPYQTALFSQRVVVGGTDLTMDCLNTLLQQKRVTGTALQAILACARNDR